MVYTIKTLYEKGMSQRAIAKELGIHRQTVKKYIDSIKEQGVKEPKINKTRILDSYKQQILNWVQDELSAQLIHDKLQENNSVNISYPTVARYVKELKKEHQEVFIPMISKPGEEAQVDYGYVGKFMINGKLTKIWCFVMTLSYSRYHYVELVASQSIESFIRSHIHAFEYFSGVPETVKIDNLKAGVIHADFYQPEIQTQYAEFLNYYNSAPITARVRRPQDKGKVEAGVKYVKNNFIKGLTHNDFEKAKEELKKWIEKTNRRTHGTIKKVPENLFYQNEKKELISLPCKRFEVYNVSKRKVNRFAHIAFGNNFYSVPAQYVAIEIQIKYTDSLLRIYHNGQQIASHPIHQGKGQYITCEHHKPDCKQYKSKEYYLESAAKIGEFTFSFSQKIIHNKPKDYQQILRGIFSLSEKYGKDKVEAACKQALNYDALSYRTIKNICQNPEIIPKEVLAVMDSGGFYNDLKVYDNLSLN